jgi:trimethylamine:corrinoid methyltransferase-like protein
MLDEEHFLFDVIADLGFQGGFLGDPSTKRYFHSEHLLPELFPSESYGFWELRGQSEDELAVARVRDMLAKHKVKPPPKEVDRELDRIYAAAQSIYGER